MPKKANKSETLTIRLDPLTRDRLEYISNLEYRPMASQIRKIVEDFVKRYAIEHKLISIDNNGKIQVIDYNYPMPDDHNEIPF